MCGFIGGTDSAWDYAAALATLSHRGPDASRLDLDGEIKVGFRRLSIIDLAETANQPMYTSGRDRWIVFNGEIYGFKRLRRELEALGHKFHTSSDTEVVLNAFVEWGDDFVSHLDGMFGIVIWDGHPFSVYTRAERVFIDGATIFDRKSKERKEPWSDFELGVLPVEVPR